MIIKNKIGYGYNDLTIVPETISNIDSRSECNPFYEDGFLPIFTAPMASVVSDKNYQIFKDNKIHPIIPRNIKLDKRLSFLFNEKEWVALSLSELKKYFITNVKDNIEQYKGNIFYICVDIANGHMKSLYDACIKAKETADKYGYEIIIMTGNIAKPATYEWICEHATYIRNIDGDKYLDTAIDYIRLSVGSGLGCITASNSGTYYPIATLIDECYQIKKTYQNTFIRKFPKIVADGGIRDYRDVNKALALGADYVMIGSLLSQCLESAGEKYDKNNKIIDVNNFKSLIPDVEQDGIILFKGYYTDDYINELMQSVYYDYDEFLENYKDVQKIELKVKFFGMASKDGQILMYGKKIKTAEGKTQILPVKYILSGWVENMIHYIKSAMSYTNCKDIKDFIGETELIVNSISAINSVNK